MTKQIGLLDGITLCVRTSAEAETLAFGPRGARLATLCVRVAEAVGHAKSERLCRNASSRSGS
ncbi:hypothetical protein [Moorena producens]|uniref:hypothetical protein n=1 Tax=Moorena producens TaxID=1155739 RepID=UPI0011EA6ABE|nr:hypothetical protein [Moorena producens]